MNRDANEALVIRVARKVWWLRFPLEINEKSKEPKERFYKEKYGLVT